MSDSPDEVAARALGNHQWFQEHCPDEDDLQIYMAFELAQTVLDALRDTADQRITEFKATLPWGELIGQDEIIEAILGSKEIKS